jgi:hypothetical protein
MHTKRLATFAVIGLAMSSISFDTEARGSGWSSGGHHHARGYVRSHRARTLRRHRPVVVRSRPAVSVESPNYTGPLIAEILQPQVLVYRRRYVPMVENGVVVDRPAARRRVVRVRTSDGLVSRPQAIRARASAAPAAAARTTDVGHIPQYNIEGWCRLVANSSNAYQSVFDNCTKTEQAALADLRADWSKVSVNMRRWCDQVVRSAEAGSYATLRSCIQMETYAAPPAESTAPTPTATPAPAEQTTPAPATPEQGQER